MRLRCRLPTPMSEGVFAADFVTELGTMIVESRLTTSKGPTLPVLSIHLQLTLTFPAHLARYWQHVYNHSEARWSNRLRIDEDHSQLLFSGLSSARSYSNLSWHKNPNPDSQGFVAIKAALSSGSNSWNVAELCGTLDLK